MRLPRANGWYSPSTVSFSGFGAGLARAPARMRASACLRGGAGVEAPLLVLGRNFYACPTLHVVCGWGEDLDLRKRVRARPRVERVSAGRRFCINRLPQNQAMPLGFCLARSKRCPPNAKPAQTFISKAKMPAKTIAMIVII